MKKTILIAAAIALTAVAVPAAAGMKSEVRFPRGASSTTLSGSVVRGDRDIYPISAGAGQTMSVRVTSPENNAVFQIWAPGTHARQSDGMWEFHGQTLPGAGEMDDATRFSGRLPARGTYYIVVGGTRGNASYNLNVSIR